MSLSSIDDVNLASDTILSVLLSWSIKILSVEDSNESDGRAKKLLATDCDWKLAYDAVVGLVILSNWLIDKPSAVWLDSVWIISSFDDCTSLEESIEILLYNSHCVNDQYRNHAYHTNT